MRNSVKNDSTENKSTRSVSSTANEIAVIKFLHKLNFPRFMRNLWFKSRRNLIKELIVERDCKNQAYCFIIQNGHFDKFSNHCRKEAVI